jgi:fermentation-respiration switch protein FrsA (DUF1100 family)
VSFANDAGQRLSAWYVPPAAGRPVALVCHGFGTNRREGQDLLPWLHAAGYGALLLDFQAHGESEGAATTVGLREVDDFLSAVRYLQDRLGVAVPLVALGFSMGASVAIMGAALTPAIRAVVADSAYATLERTIARSFRHFFHLPPRVFLRPTIWFAERMARARVGSVRPIEAAARLAPRPLLLIQGASDRIVDPEDAALLHAAAGEPKALWWVEGCDHVGARQLYPDVYAGRVLACFEQVARRSDGGPDAMDGELLVADDLRVGELAVADVQH